MKTPRRDFLTTSLLAGSACALGAQENDPDLGVVDIHQHVNYLGRFDDILIAHQKKMGISKTVLLPSATAVSRPSTHEGKSNGLAARAHGNPACKRIADAHPEHFVYFANEVPDLDTAKQELEKYLKAGAIGIGEQKFGVDCDSVHIQKIAEIAQEYDVPVLLHFQHEKYNMGFERFHKILEKYPKVNFIGHAQTWWGNIDKNHVQEDLYPKGPVTPGGITDRYLSDYPNMFGDLSAGSGRNSLQRDLDHAREFLLRHQDKLMFGSDCPDHEGEGPKCIGTTTLAIVRERIGDQPEALGKILSGNAKRIMRL